MPNLKSMKLTEADAKKEIGLVPSPEKGPRFPFGLTLELNETVLGKLGVKGDPSVKDKVLVGAKAEVVSVSSNQGSDGKKRRMVRLQITELALAKDTGDRKKTEQVLYSGS